MDIQYPPPQIFQTIFQRLAPLHVRCVIAGGAVVDFKQAKDIDVFVLEHGYRHCVDVMRALGGSGKVSESDLKDAADMPYEGGHADEFYRAGICSPSWSPKPIHITGFSASGTGKSTVEELLETFDLSVHAWAMDEKYRQHRIPTSTLPGQPITVAHIRSTTAARLLKLSQRYHPSVHLEHVH